MFTKIEQNGCSFPTDTSQISCYLTLNIPTIQMLSGITLHRRIEFAQKEISIFTLYFKKFIHSICSTRYDYEMLMANCSSCK